MTDAAPRVSDEDIDRIEKAVRFLPTQKMWSEELITVFDFFRARIKTLEAERDEARRVLAKDARVEAILVAVLAPSDDPEHGTRDHLPRVLRDYLAEACGAAHKTGFDDGYAEGSAKFKDDLSRAEAALARAGEVKIAQAVRDVRYWAGNNCDYAHIDGVMKAVELLQEYVECDKPEAESEVTG